MTTPMRALILADEAGADPLIRELRQGYPAVHFARVGTVAALRQALESPSWDVVICEHGQPALVVPAVLACVEKAARLLPVVVVTAGNGPEVAATAAGLPVGVRGYVSKAQLSRLAPVVRQLCKEAEAERQRLLAEQKLRLFEEAVGAIAQGVLILEAVPLDYRISYVNRTFEELTGYPARELLGRGLRVLSRARSGTFPLEACQAALREGRTTELEWRLVRPDGGEAWLGVSLKPVRDESNGLTHFMAVVTDQSGRKRLEEQLRQAHKMEVIGRMAGGVAHDFNNLLTAILGYSQLLLREIEPETTSHQNLLQIIQAGERAERLARRLMTLGGERPRAPEPLDVNPVVEDTLQLLRDSLGERVELILALETVSPVLTDPVHLQQVLMNLVLNARDAMPQGGRLIVHTADVRVDESLAPRGAGALGGWYVQLAVSDTGCGMSEAVKARLFEPFFTTKGPGKGTGLGLAVVRDIVRGLGGFIEVDTRPGAGSTFRVFFPRSAVPALVRGAPLAP